jgi:hypothetical protein
MFAELEHNKFGTPKRVLHCAAIKGDTLTKVD